MKSYPLTSGDNIPAMGLGTWQMEDGIAAEAVASALELGYRHIDGAAIYGNETDVGKGLAQGFSSGISREEVFVTSKLWNDSHKPEHVRPALEKTLSDLQLDQLNLFLIHWPVAIKHGLALPGRGEDFIPIEEAPVIETWQAMEQLVSDGLVREIGVCNFSTALLRDLGNQATIKPAMLQIELHPYLVQEKLVRFCKESGIAVTGFRPWGLSRIFS